MHTKYEVSTSNGSKVIANVKVDNRQTNKQTGQKQYAPDHSIRGHKNTTLNKQTIKKNINHIPVKYFKQMISSLF